MPSLNSVFLFLVANSANSHFDPSAVTPSPPEGRPFVDVLQSSPVSPPCPPELRFDELFLFAVRLDGEA